MADTTKTTSSVKEPQVMQKVDLKSDTISQRDKMYIERMNAMRAQATASKLQKSQASRRNLFVGLGLASIAVGAYAYSFYAVGQETFLDDFEDPNKVKD